MAIEIKMPRLSQTTDEVRLLNWLVHEGDTVQKGDPLCEVETDKVTMEVESFEGGSVLKLLAETDTVIDAGTVIALLGEKGERVPDSSEASVTVRDDGGEAPSKKHASSVVQEVQKTFDMDLSPGHSAASAAVPPAAQGADVRATRLVRNIAQKRNIDLGSIRGSGPRGMIVKADLDAYLASGKTVAQAPGAAPGDSVALSSHQRAVAHSLARSSMEAPHFYLKCSLICDRIVSYREKHRGTQGGKLAVDAFFLFAVARALTALPRLNGYYRNDSFVPRNSVDINIAISAGEELYAPLLKNVQGKSIEQIDVALRKLAAKTRENRLEKDDMQQGSFTVTNLGMYPVDEFAAIINPPQSGILSIGRMRRELVICSGDTMQIHTICTMTGSFDHRIVNGTQGAAFMQHIQEILEGLDIP